ncbi:excisionase family DNA-binding protein [Flavobacteriaceae bacterium]|jgi:excisionase family DNA binding protein|nr:excisionase family DNA-binding protein [Flavobacteriaceae bacterium]
MNELVSKEKLLEKLNVSKGKLDSMIKNNQIPFIRMGKVIRFDENEVYEYLKKQNG